MAHRSVIGGRIFVAVWATIAVVVGIVCVRELIRIGLAEGGATATTIGGVVFAAAMLASGWKLAIGSRTAVVVSILLAGLALAYSLAFAAVIGRRFGDIWFGIALAGSIYFVVCMVVLIRRLRGVPTERGS
jgi:hypothetical protein